jgi:hypothetical protein
MIITIVKKWYDNIVFKVNEIETGYNDIINMACNPELVNDKPNTPYILPFSHNFNNKSSVPRISSSAKSYELIILDVDKGYSIKTISDYLNNNNLQYVIYTSFSSTPEVEKFRVMIPTNRALTMEEYNHPVFRRAFKKLFYWNDENTVKYQGYCYPIKTKYYQVVYNESDNAVPFDWGDETFTKLIKDEWKSYLEYQKKTNDKKPITNLQPHPNAAENRHYVTRYLNTPFPSKNGNTNSNKWLYVAICCCVGCNDMDTLTKVKHKARLEGWSDKEIEQKIQSANNRRK